MDSVFTPVPVNMDLLMVQFSSTVFSGVQQQLMTLRKQYMLLYNLTWGLPDPTNSAGQVFSALTVAQRLASLGTRARSLFEEASELAAYYARRIAAAPPGSLPDGLARPLPGIPPQWSVTFNPDGSANLSLAPVP